MSRRARVLVAVVAGVLLVGTGSVVYGLVGSGAGGLLSSLAAVVGSGRVLVGGARLHRQLSRPRRLSGAREPSGAVALPSLGGFLVVDDEPYCGRSKGIYFYRQRGSRLMRLPVVLPKGRRIEWDDWEGVAATSTRVFMLTSHCYNSAYRSKICHFPIGTTRVKGGRLHIGGPLVCVGGLKQRQRILDLLHEAARRVGFTMPKRIKYRGPKRGGLDLEAFMYSRRSRRFFIGLRGPLAAKGGRRYAIVLEMSWRVGRPRFRYAGLVDLGGRGLRSFTEAPGGGVLMSAGPVGRKGRFDLLLGPDFPRRAFVIGKTRLLTPHGFPVGDPRIKPEGLAFLGGWLLVTSDSGDWDDTAAHYYLLPQASSRRGPASRRPSRARRRRAARTRTGK